MESDRFSAGRASASDPSCQLRRGFAGFAPFDLVDLTIRVRDFLEPHWPGWHAMAGISQPGIASTNTCGRSGLFLVEVLRDTGLDAEWRTGVPRLSQSGPEEGPFGYFSGFGWESHSWVQSSDWILDVTADQFGAPPVIVTPANDVRYRIGPVDPASPENILKRRQTVDELWPLWRDYCA